MADDKDTSNDSDVLGLAVGLGVGIPVILVIGIMWWVTMRHRRLSRQEDERHKEIDLDADMNMVDDDVFLRKNGVSDNAADAVRTAPHRPFNIPQGPIPNNSRGDLASSYRGSLADPHGPRAFNDDTSSLMYTPYLHEKATESLENLTRDLNSFDAPSYPRVRGHNSNSSLSSPRNSRRNSMSYSTSADDMSVSHSTGPSSSSPLPERAKSRGHATVLRLYDQYQPRFDMDTEEESESEEPYASRNSHTRRSCLPTEPLPGQAKRASLDEAAENEYNQYDETEELASRNPDTLAAHFDQARGKSPFESDYETPASSRQHLPVHEEDEDVYRSSHSDEHSDQYPRRSYVDQETIEESRSPAFNSAATDNTTFEDDDVQPEFVPQPNPKVDEFHFGQQENNNLAVQNEAEVRPASSVYEMSTEAQPKEYSANSARPSHQAQELNGAYTPSTYTPAPQAKHAQLAPQYQPQLAPQQANGYAQYHPQQGSRGQLMNSPTFSSPRSTPLQSPVIHQSPSAHSFMGSPSRAPSSTGGSNSGSRRGSMTSRAIAAQNYQLADVPLANSSRSNSERNLAQMRQQPPPNGAQYYGRPAQVAVDDSMFFEAPKKFGAKKGGKLPAASKLTY